MHDLCSHCGDRLGRTVVFCAHCGRSACSWGCHGHHVAGHARAAGQAAESSTFGQPTETHAGSRAMAEGQR